MKKAAKKLLGAAAAVGGVYVGLVTVLDNLLVRRKWTVPSSFGEKIANADMSDLNKKSEEFKQVLKTLPVEKHCIVSDRGEKLVGWLFRPEEESKVFVLCAHGYRSSGRSEFSGISQYYRTKKGFNAMVVDHTASGDSEGNFVGFGHFEVEDCMKWVRYLIENFGDDITIILHGISMGSATVMLMAGEPDLPENVKMVVADCGFTSAIDEFTHKSKDLHIDKLPAIIPLVNLINRVQAGYDFRDTDAFAAVQHAKVPMLFIHGGADLFVPTFMSEKNYEACSSEIKDILIIDGADHAQSYIVDQEAYEAKIDEFMDRVGIAHK